ncbi:MAG TPA: hypothetical protein VGL93_10655 [Streptosporangiaceae bacterium]|jgi:hypothetical protein
MYTMYVHPDVLSSVLAALALAGIYGGFRHLRLLVRWYIETEHAKTTR